LVGAAVEDGGVGRARSVTNPRASSRTCRSRRGTGTAPQDVTPELKRRAISAGLPRAAMPTMILLWYSHSPKGLAACSIGENTLHKRLGTSTPAINAGPNLTQHSEWPAPSWIRTAIIVQSSSTFWRTAGPLSSKSQLPAMRRITVSVSSLGAPAHRHRLQARLYTTPGVEPPDANPVWQPAASADSPSNHRRPSRPLNRAAVSDLNRHRERAQAGKCSYLVEPSGNAVAPTESRRNDLIPPKNFAGVPVALVVASAGGATNNGQTGGQSSMPMCRSRPALCTRHTIPHRPPGHFPLALITTSFACRPSPAPPQMPFDKSNGSPARISLRRTLQVGKKMPCVLWTGSSYKEVG